MKSSPHVAGVKLEDGNLPVVVHDQIATALDLNFSRSLGATTLDAIANIGDTSITLADATGFSDLDTIAILSVTEGGYFGAQVGVSVGNVITLDTPIDIAKSVGSLVLRLTKNLNVVGSLGAPIIYAIGPVVTPIDITRITGYIQDEDAMDDALFGGIAKLTNGIVLRLNNGVIKNIFNAKTNSDLALLACGVFTYTDKAPAGKFGARFCITFAGQENHGVSLRLNSGDILQLLVQDPLDGLEIFNLMAQGHEVA
jgi:hypothetical protein